LGHDVEGKYISAQRETLACEVGKLVGGARKLWQDLLRWLLLEAQFWQG